MLSSSTKPYFVTPTPTTPTTTSITYNTFSRNVADDNYYTVSLEATLLTPAYIYTPAYTNAPVPTSDSKFYLTAINPCFTSTFETFGTALNQVVGTKPSTIENFMQFVGFALTSKNTYLFNDTASIAYTWPTD